jgi:hypothetical protein
MPIVLPASKVGHVLLDLLRSPAEVDAAGARGALLVDARREPNVVARHFLLDHRRGQVTHVGVANGLGGNTAALNAWYSHPRCVTPLTIESLV